VAGEGGALFALDSSLARVGRYNHLVLAQEQNQEVFPLAARPQLAENSRQGFSTRKTASHQGKSAANFTVTLGLRATVVENGVRKTYRARYYNPTTGRFLSEDPMGFAGGFNLYAYASNNPLSFADAFGTCPATPAAAANPSKEQCRNMILNFDFAQILFAMGILELTILGMFLYPELGLFIALEFKIIVAAFALQFAIWKGYIDYQCAGK
jgi:RHS repeat-associated protein